MDGPPTNSPGAERRTLSSQSATPSDPGGASAVRGAAASSESTVSGPGCSSGDSTRSSPPEPTRSSSTAASSGSLERLKDQGHAFDRDFVRKCVERRPAPLGRPGVDQVPAQDL